MWKLVIEDDEGKRTVVPLTRDEYTLGRREGNTIRLTERNVSRERKTPLMGGIVVIEAFHEDAARKFRIGGSICATGEPPHAFQGLRTIHYEEPVAMPDFGPQPMRLVRYAGEKPRP